MNKIGTLDIVKAYLGNKELTANNAYMGEISLIKGSGPTPVEMDYFYLQPLSTGNYSVSTSDEAWKQNNTFEFSLNKTNWRKFSSLEHQDTSVGFDVYMANNPDLVALALDINAYNTYVVGENCKVFIFSMMMGGRTDATFLGTDENFAYYSGTPEDPMDFLWELSGGMEVISDVPSDRMFEWDGTDFEGTDTNISNYSSFSVAATIITETIPLAANDKLYLRNTGGSIHSGIINSIQNVNYNIGGILNTLTDYTDNTYTITTSYADGLFKGDTHLISAGDLELPATTLADSCYSYMFYGCTALTTAPELPATTLASYCYQYMFYRCTSLTTAPELPATSLAEYCYYNMFYGCTALTTAPELPATTLANGCYSYMFLSCSRLTNAPELPATTLANNCYCYMFLGCSRLTNAPELPATTLANYCYLGMFANCSNLTTAPELPATTLANYCYLGMFGRCSKLNKVITYANNISASNCLANWCNNVSATGDFYNLGNATYSTGGSGIPTGWTVHTSL